MYTGTIVEPVAVAMVRFAATVLFSMRRAVKMAWSAAARVKRSSVADGWHDSMAGDRVCVWLAVSTSRGSIGPPLNEAPPVRAKIIVLLAKT